jgi:ComF family protein
LASGAANGGRAAASDGTAFTGRVDAPGTLEACAANARSHLPWLDWLLPPRCGSCRSLGSWLCDRCRLRIRRLSEPLCERCGRELEFAGAGCGCRHRLRWLSRAVAAAAYEGPLEKAIHRFKYEGWRALAPVLADLVVDRLAADAAGEPLLVAVPLHGRRQRARGYNQSELLAAELRARLRLAAPRGRLVRLRDTPPQVGLDRLRRQANVGGAFAWRGASPAGRIVVVVDDVATTGATLEACAAALRAAGSGPVHGLTVARVSV